MSTNGLHQNDIPELPRLTQYNFENLFKVYTDRDDLYYYNITNSIFFPDDIANNAYFNYRISGSNISWTYLSYIHYGTIKLWWVLCTLNNVDNPMILPEPGTFVKILKPNALRDVLQQIQQNH